MTTIVRRWPRWALAAALAVAAGCGQPPPMVSMSPPGAGGDPLAVDITDDAFKAQALGESGRTEETPEGAGADDEASPPLAPTAPGEEVRLDSGLTYSTIEPGDPDGEMAEVGDSITVFYEGKLDDGTVFDSNMGERSTEFALAPGLIQGWILGIPGMKVGERRKLVIPADLGYGDRGFPPSIPAGARLTFEVKLVDVNKR